MVADWALKVGSRCFSANSTCVGIGRVAERMTASARCCAIAAKAATSPLSAANDDWIYGKIRLRGGMLNLFKHHPGQWVVGVADNSDPGPVPGINSRISSRVFAANSVEVPETPVMFPPGRARVETNPLATGSPAGAITMGISLVARLAATTAGVREATMMSGLLRTRVCRQFRKEAYLSLRRPNFNLDVTAFDMAKFAQRLAIRPHQFWVGDKKHSNAGHALLRLRIQRTEGRLRIEKSRTRAASSFDHLVSASEHRRRHGEAQRLGSLEVDQQLVLCRRLHRQDQQASHP